MKIIKNILPLLLLSLAVMSCERDEVKQVDVDINTDKIKYNVNDTVKFLFTGHADMVTFYSGENGSEYKHRNRVELEGGKLEVSFETQELYGIQDQNLNLLVSTDFGGVYSKDAVQAATWTNITDRMTWCEAPSGAVGVRTISDYVDVSDLLVSGKPVYFAFRYLGVPSTTGSAQQRTWRVYQFNIQNRFSESEIVPVANRTNAGWQAVTINDPAAKGLWHFTTQSTMIYYDPQSNLQDVEKWAITKRFDPNKVAPDNGISIKKYADNSLNKYEHVFTQAGEYEVTFVLRNSNYNGTEEKIKTLKVIVE